MFKQAFHEGFVEACKEAGYRPELAERAYLIASLQNRMQTLEKSAQNALTPFLLPDSSVESLRGAVTDLMPRGDDWPVEPETVARRGLYAGIPLGALATGGSLSTAAAAALGGALAAPTAVAGYAAGRGIRNIPVNKSRRTSVGDYLDDTMGHIGSAVYKAFHPRAAARLRGHDHTVTAWNSK